MRIEGNQLGEPHVELIVIPMKDQNVVFKATAVLDFSDFDRLVPEPKMPTKHVRGKGEVPNEDSQSYKKLKEDYAKKRIAFMVLKSLQATPGLTWDTVDMENPDTWQNYEEELKKAGLGEYARAFVLKGVIQANHLDEERLTEARESFLAEKSQPQD